MGREGFGTQVPEWRIAVRIREASELAKDFKRISAGRRVPARSATTMRRLDCSAEATHRRHTPPRGRANARPMTGSGGVSSTPRVFDSIIGVSEYWIVRS